MRVLEGCILLIGTLLFSWRDFFASFSILQRHRVLGGVSQHREDQCAIGLLAEDLSCTRSMFCTRFTILLDSASNAS